MKHLLILLFSLLFSGCVSPVASNIEQFDLSKLREIDLQTLCMDYQVYKRDNARSSGKSALQMSVEQTGFYNLASPLAMSQLETVMLEKGITPEELSAIKSDQVFIGMSRNALYAAWGKPHIENVTTTATGTRIQHVFRSYHSNYVYTQDGIITAIQN